MTIRSAEGHDRDPLVELIARFLGALAGLRGMDHVAGTHGLRY